MKSAYLVIAHGSRDPQTGDALQALVKRFEEIKPGHYIEGAYLEIGKPDIPQGIRNCIEKGAKQIFVIPLMVFPGKHVKDHIPAIIQEAHEAYPDVNFHYAGPLCEDPKFLELLEAKANG